MFLLLPPIWSIPFFSLRKEKVTVVTGAHHARERKRCGKGEVRAVAFPSRSGGSGRAAVAASWPDLLLIWARRGVRAGDVGNGTVVM